MWHVAIVYFSRLQLAAPTGRSPFAALPLDLFSPWAVLQGGGGVTPPPLPMHAWGYQQFMGRWQWNRTSCARGGGLAKAECRVCPPALLRSRGCFNGASIAAVSEYGEDEAEYLLPPYTLVQCIRVDRGAKTISFDVMVDNRDWELRHECLGGAQHGPTTPKNVPYTWHVTAAEILDGFQALDGVIQASVWIKFWQEGAKKYEDVPSQVPPWATCSALHQLLDLYRGQGCP